MNFYPGNGILQSKIAEGATTWYCYEYGQAVKELDSGGGVRIRKKIKILLDLLTIL
ncbi:MAG: hypothetical protein FWG53_09730 [Clostridiales bacterium]|nr:hypothetical protein [Clostridiales bacterium]